MDFNLIACGWPEAVLTDEEAANMGWLRQRALREATSLSVAHRVSIQAQDDPRLAAAVRRWVARNRAENKPWTCIRCGATLMEPHNPIYDPEKAVEGFCQACGGRLPVRGSRDILNELGKLEEVLEYPVGQAVGAIVQAILDGDYEEAIGWLQAWRGWELLVQGPLDWTGHPERVPLHPDYITARGTYAVHHGNELFEVEL